MSVHKDIKYQCEKCEYKATQRGHLKTHKMSIHEGIKYQCDLCDHKSTQKQNLKIHKMSVHISMWSMWV